MVLATRVTSTRLIGRTAELADLEAAFAAAADGHPSIAFVAGESGVGKSRLVSELSARAKAQGARTLCGECVELGEGELPYAPLVAALRPLSRDGDPVLEEVGDAARAELSTLLPELGSPDAPAQRDDGAGRPSGGCSRRCWRCWSASAARTRSCCCSRTSTGPTAPRARSWPSSPAR